MPAATAAATTVDVSLTAAAVATSIIATNEIHQLLEEPRLCFAKIKRFLQKMRGKQLRL